MTSRKITRRAALIGAAALVVAPAIAHADPVTMPSAVEQAIAKHKAAYRAYSAAIEHEEAINAALAANPAYDANPKVQIGARELGSGAKEPTLVSDVVELERYRRIWLGAVEWNDRGVNVVNERFDRKRDELMGLLQDARRLEKQAGLGLAITATCEASTAEEHAAMAVMLATPLNVREAARKRRYMQRHGGSFKPQDWDAYSLFDAIKANVPALADTEMAGAA